MTNQLPGLALKDPAAFAFAFDGPAYAQIVTDTLGNTGQPGDDLEVSAQALAVLMAAYEAEVTADTLTDSLPDGAIFQTTVAELTALGIEIDLDTDMQGISDLLDGLSLGMSVLDILQQWLNAFFKWAFNIAVNITVLNSHDGGISIPISIPGLPIGGPH